LRLERNLGEAIRLLQARQAQFHFASEIEWGVNQVTLAIVQRLAGDTVGAKSNAEQARNMLDDSTERLGSNCDLFSQNVETNRPFQFQKRSPLLIRVHNETLSIVAMRINNPDCSPF
jgi:hypothetical protein